MTTTDTRRPGAAEWISEKAKWTKPADWMDPYVVRLAVGYAGAEIMASADPGWQGDLAQLKDYAALFGMDQAQVMAAIDVAARRLMGG